MLTQKAAAIIVAHNHPSDDPTLSSEDVAVTYEAETSGKLALSRSKIAVLGLSIYDEVEDPEQERAL